MGQLKKILLIDDDPIANFLSRMVVEETLTLKPDINADIEIAENGQEGIEIIKECINKQNTIIYILLDINMPIMDGFEFLDELELVPEKPHYKIILVSSSTSITDYHRASNFKITGYICKPITFEKLKFVLDSSEN